MTTFDPERLDVYKAAIEFVAIGNAGHDLLLRIVAMLTRLTKEDGPGTGSGTGTGTG